MEVDEVIAKKFHIIHLSNWYYAYNSFALCHKWIYFSLHFVVYRSMVAMSSMINFLNDVCSLPLGAFSNVFSNFNYFLTFDNYRFMVAIWSMINFLNNDCS